MDETNGKNARGIESYSLSGIQNLVESLGLPRFRTRQLVQWLYAKGVPSYDDMHNLPAKMRADLAKAAPLRVPIVKNRRVSKDGSRKYVLELADGSLVESVGIPSRETAEGEPKRLSVCFSTQVGCPMGCAFCATGKRGLKRNLLPGEMAGQILCVQHDFGVKAKSVVAMGQGEPFLNYENLVDALRIINHPDALNIGARHITVSSCGILEGIVRFGKEPEQFTLAISLHSACQATRDRLMPRCASMPLSSLKQSLHAYHASSKRRISFEYLMIAGVNDSRKDLETLIGYCSGLHVYINLITLNAIEGSPWRPSAKSTVQNWLRTLEREGIEACLRDSRGSDIDGACGQLINRTS